MKRVAQRLEHAFAAIAGGALLSMMALTFADVIGRKLLGGSIGGAVELTELLMLVMIFFALPLASLRGEHIVFDLLDRHLPAAVLRVQRVLANVVAAGAFGGAAWVVHQRAQRTAEFGDITSVLEIRIAPFQELAGALLLLTALAHLWLALRVARRDPDAP